MISHVILHERFFSDVFLINKRMNVCDFPITGDLPHFLILCNLIFIAVPSLNVKLSAAFLEIIGMKMCFLRTQLSIMCSY